MSCSKTTYAMNLETGPNSLEPPLAARWVVKLEKVNEYLFFGKGWDGFLNDNSIELGGLLVFRLIDDAKLYVRIYKKTACEETIIGRRSIGESISCERKEKQENVTEKSALPKHHKSKLRDQTVDLGKTHSKCATANEKTVTGSDNSESHEFQSQGFEQQGHGVDEVSVDSKCQSAEPSGISADKLCPDISSNKEKRIPKKFVCKYGKYLPDVVALKDPSDTVWHVELKNVDGDVWIRSGWQEFIEHHFICAGHFLIFKYDGKLQFYVLIFDMSGNEIDYLPKGLQNHGEKFCVPEKEGEYGTDVALLDVSSNGDDSISKRRSSKRASVTRIPVNTEEKDGVIQKASSFKSKFQCNHHI
ncbi:hypothetical protein IFM89_032102 [Coptis chinensis]|uniref:TF-B3 domain-containing protein n=1 Tax=Coptis chinensis TaxID=261450 RepID=A0A835I7J7_9MAGN|nr:hypothetical protein IFM89_032102 [Coptis chinensis]